MPRPPNPHAFYVMLVGCRCGCECGRGCGCLMRMRMCMCRFQFAFYVRASKLTFQLFLSHQRPLFLPQPHPPSKDNPPLAPPCHGLEVLSVPLTHSFGNSVSHSLRQSVSQWVIWFSSWHFLIFPCSYPGPGPSLFGPSNWFMSVSRKPFYYTQRSKAKMPGIILIILFCLLDYWLISI